MKFLNFFFFFFWENSVDLWQRKLTLKVRFQHFLTNHNSSQDCFKIIFFENVSSWAKLLHFMTHHVWNSTTRLTLIFTHVFFLQNLPADALPDGPVREKMANFKRPKKFKTSENDFSHGSFFLRIGGISKSIHFDLIIYRNKAWISFKFLVN